MHRFLIFAFVLCVQCGSQDDPVALVPGAIRVHSAITEAELFVDGMERGALRDGTQIELQPGPHAIEARRGTDVLAREVIVAQTAVIFDVTLTQDVAATVANADLEEPAPPTAEPAEPAVDGEGLGSEVLSRIVRSNARGLQRCFSRQLQQDQGTEPLLTTVEIDISPDGTVLSARATGLLPGGLGSCIETIVHRWRFPASGQAQSASFPVVFRAG